METNIKLKEIKINSSIKKYELKTTLLGYANKGLPGKDGTNGENGVTFTPSVDNEGNLSWTNNGNLNNPETKNIKGPKGDKGDAGPNGEPGEGVPSGGATGQVLKKKSNTDYDTEWVNESGGSGGTSDYTDLTNKPKINNVELNGNKSLSDLGITSPTKTSDLVNDSGFLTNSIVELQGTDANPVNINTLEAGYYRITGTLILGEHTMGTGLNNWDTLVIGEWYTSSVSTSYRKIIPTKLTVSMGKLQNPGMYYIISANESEGNITYTIKPYTMQEELISGTNIKTINNESILGAGNLAIAGGADIPIGPTPPENPEEGDFWIDTSANGETYGDTLPIGAMVEYNGTTVPQGYEKVSDNNIIESGSNDNGNWIKYSDGTMICTNRYFIQELGNTTTQSGALYVSNEIEGKSFPATFTSRPEIFFNFENATWGDKNIISIKTIGYPTTSVAPSIQLVSATSSTNTAINFEYLAIGKWK